MIAANAPVAHDDDAVGDGEDLRQAMGDEDVATPRAFSVRTRSKRRRRLVFGERGRRLVEDEQRERSWTARAR